MSALPDFGYGEDNYILAHMNTQPNKWRMLTGLLGEHEKFDWLMGFLQIKKLEKEIQVQEQLQEEARKQRAALRERKKKNKEQEWMNDPVLRFRRVEGTKVSGQEELD